MDKTWLFANYIGAWLQIFSNVCSFFNIVVIYDYFCFNDVEPIGVHWYNYSFAMCLSKIGNDRLILTIYTKYAFSFNRTCQNPGGRVWPIRDLLMLKPKLKQDDAMKSRTSISAIIKFSHNRCSLWPNPETADRLIGLQHGFRRRHNDSLLQIRFLLQACMVEISNIITIWTWTICNEIGYKMKMQNHERQWNYLCLVGMGVTTTFVLVYNFCRAI